MRFPARLRPAAVVTLCAAAIATFALAAGPAGQKSAAVAATGSVDPSLFKALHWRGIGPYRGGRALAVTGVPGDPTTFYVGYVAGGVWKTIDAGATWTSLTDNQKFDSIGAIAVAPSNHNILYVGTGEAAPRGDITYGNGVYKSTDGGKTWNYAGLKDTRQIGALIVDPTNPDIVLVAALGHAFGPNPDRGVFRTTDGGKTWSKVLYKDDKTGAIDVAFDPNDSKIVYAAMWQALRQPWSFSSGGPGSGLYRSGDGGLTWSHLTGNGLPGGILGRIDVSVSGAKPSRIFAMIEAKDGGLYRSDDSGNHWQRINNDGRLTQRAWYFSKIFADPKNADMVYALNTGAFRSSNGGKSFDLLPARHGDHHGFWLDPTAPTRMIDASDGGATVSVDNGKTWSTQDNQPTAQFYHVAVDNRFPYYVYGAQQDNSNVAIASFSDFGVITDKDWYVTGGGECGFVIPDPRDANIVYSNSENQINRFNKHTMQWQSIGVWPIDASGHAASDLQHRFQWTSPMILSAFNPDTIYTGMDGVFKSTDRGNSWTEISGDLTRNDKSKQGPSGGPITHDITSVEYYDTVFALAELPLKRGMLWAGTDDGLVQLTADDGKHWNNVTPHDMPAWGTVNLIEASRFDVRTAYVAVDRHRLDDIKPYVFKTTDGGKTWTRLDHGIPEGAFVHAVREDPVRRGLLYAGTETGVYVSFDGGQNWQSLQLNLPQSPVHDLVVKGDDLVVATHGRSFWILDDVTPLRQVTPGAALDTMFYAPQTAIRLYYPDQVDAHPPVGANPPAGALIDYYFRSKPKGDIALEIDDAQGKPVRHLSSKKSNVPEQPPEWPDQITATDRLPADAGMNRFVWNLRYDDPVQIPGAFYEGTAPRGPLIAPGRYTLKLTVDGKTTTEPFVLIGDPRAKGTEAAVRQKVALAMVVYKDTDALHRAVNDIRDVKAKVAALHAKKGANPALLGEGDAIVKAVTPIEEKLMQVNIKGSEANLNFPGMLNEQIYAFAESLDDADTPPTKPEIALYATFHSQLAAELDAWNKLKQTRVTAFVAKAK